MKKIFISRDLEEGHAFAKSMEEAGLEVFGKSLIEFTAIPFKKVPESDWIFFYSKKGIQYYFDRLDAPDFWSGVRMGMPRKVKQLRYATFGQGSGRFLKTFRGLTPDFAGPGNAIETTAAFLKVAKKQKVLFVRGENSLKSVQELLTGAEVEIEELVAYHNCALLKFTLPQCHYLVFTSPLNVQAYYGRYKVKKWQKIFAIGETTAAALAELGIEKVAVAEVPSLGVLGRMVVKGVGD